MAGMMYVPSFLFGGSALTRFWSRFYNLVFKENKTPSDAEGVVKVEWTLCCFRIFRADFIASGLAADAENSGGFGAVVAALFQHFHDMGSLNIL